MEADCSTCIRKALSANIRSDDGPFNQADNVYYNRGADEQWKGPGTVIGQDSAVVLVRHGGALVRAHRSCLKHVVTTVRDEVVAQESAEKSPPVMTVGPDDTDDEMSEPPPEVKTEDPAVSTSQNFDETFSEVPSSKPLSCYERIGKGQQIRFTSTLADFENQEKEAVVLSRGGKASGKHKNFWNIEYQTPKEISGQVDTVDIGSLNNLTVKDVWEGNSDYESALAVQTDDFLETKLEELESWRQKDVFASVQNWGQPYLTCRWVTTNKNGRKKARLVARGFEDPDLSTLVKDSPTCSKEAFSIMLTVATHHNWSSNVVDIRTAFLQGLPLDREVFVKPPDDVQNPLGHLWKLKKCVYVLADAARNWYEKV